MEEKNQCNGGQGTRSKTWKQQRSYDGEPLGASKGGRVIKCLKFQNVLAGC